MTCCACATQAPEPASSPATVDAPAAITTGTLDIELARSRTPSGAEPALDPGVELPAGDGRELVLTQCLVCHQLTALTLFKDFYTRASWHSLVISMRAYGAELDNDEIELVSDYLARHFGVGER